MLVLFDVAELRPLLLLILVLTDLIIARTVVQSNKANDKVAEVCYAVQIQFQIIRGTGCGAYIFRKSNKLDSPGFKFMPEDLYILQPSLKPYKPVDGSDTRYLNQSHTLIVNPLKNPLDIELYNEKWFGIPPKKFSPPFKYDHDIVSFPPDVTTPSPSLSKFHKEINNSPPQLLLEKEDDNDYYTNSYTSITP